MARAVEVVPPSDSASRPSPPRRTRVVVKRVGPWSVLRFSLVFYFCMMVALWLGLFIVYQFLGSIGVLHSIEHSFRNLNPASRNKLNWGDWSFHTGWIFSRLFLIGLVMVLFGSIVNLIGAFLYNLLADMMGGIELTLAERR
jgi:Transmembrane domain of unknown function (DUF3566)